MSACPEPQWAPPEARILIGDCREVLPTLPDRSVNCCVTSPPYFGLRDYGTGIWEGGDGACPHAVRPTATSAASSSLEGSRETANHRQEGYRGLCGRCGARRIDRQIGLEETPEAYVAELVGVFREVRRMLTDDGTLWLVLGDSYAGSWGAQGRREVPATISRNQVVNHPKRASHTGSIRQAGLKPKDLIGIPWMTAFALRADGWYLRAECIWSKPNPMPESVTDRPTRAHEQVFLLAKSARYFYDQAAIREPFATDPRENYPRRARITGWGRQPSAAAVLGQPQRDKSGGFPPAGEARNKRSVFTISTVPYPEGHFAVFPPALVAPCILAGCPEGGTVLDPFAGSGTVAEVALKLNRSGLLIELNPDYLPLALRRTAQRALGL